MAALGFSRLVQCLLVVAFLTPSFSHAQDSAPVVPSPDVEFVAKKLKEKKFSKAFIADVMKLYEAKGFEEVLRLNVLLFLKKSDYHGPQVTTDATEEVRNFVKENKAALDKAEETYKVPGNVIASLMFIESRYGRNTGDFHVPSVYLHLLQAPKRSVQVWLQSQATKYADKVSKKQRLRIRQRTHEKAKWALAELRALQKVHRWNWKLDQGFRGSFSGAFGIPQFLPSSYIKWARSANPPAQPDLSKVEDAVMSVGHYLNDHGWKTGDAKSRVSALMKYNNSEDYAKAILSLADTVNPRKTAAAVPEQ